MRSFFVLLGLGTILLTIAIVVRSGKLMRDNLNHVIDMFVWRWPIDSRWHGVFW